MIAKLNIPARGAKFARRLFIALEAVSALNAIGGRIYRLEGGTP